MRVLSKKDDFPDLPNFKRSIIVRPNAPKDLSNAMVNAIRRAV